MKASPSLVQAASELLIEYKLNANRIQRKHLRGLEDTSFREFKRGHISYEELKRDFDAALGRK